MRLRLLYAILCVLLSAAVLCAAPPAKREQAPPVQRERAPAVKKRENPPVVEASGVVTWRYFQDARGQWWMVPETPAPEVVGRPFQEPSSIQPTAAPPASTSPRRGRERGWSGGTPARGTYTIAQNAASAGSINCTSYR